FAFAWRRAWPVEAYGLGWIAIAYLPISNLIVPHGVVMAERLLYLPSVGLALAAGAALDRLPRQRFALALVVLVTAGAISRTVRAPAQRPPRIRPAPGSRPSTTRTGRASPAPDSTGRSRS